MFVNGFECGGVIGFVVVIVFMGFIMGVFIVIVLDIFFVMFLFVVSEGFVDCLVGFCCFGVINGMVVFIDFLIQCVCIVFVLFQGEVIIIVFNGEFNLFVCQCGECNYVWFSESFVFIMEQFFMDGVQYSVGYFYVIVMYGFDILYGVFFFGGVQVQCRVVCYFIKGGFVFFWFQG